MFSRRAFLRASAGAAVTGGLLSLNQSAAAQQDGPRLGDSREIFDSWFGQGVSESPIGATWITYGDGSTNTPEYSVLFNQQNLAESICITFKNYDNAGLNPEGEIGQTRFLRPDADQGVTIYLGPQDLSSTTWAVTNWHSPSLASDLNRSGNVVVMDKVPNLSEVGAAVLQQTFISMEAFEVDPLEGTGQNLGPHNSIDDWSEFAGTPVTAGEFEFTNGYVPGDWQVNPGSVIVYPSPSLPWNDGQALVESMLPTSTTSWTSFIPGSPVTFDSMRLHGLETAYGKMIAVQWFTGEEGSDTSTSSRLGVGAFDYQYHLSI